MGIHSKQIELKPHSNGVPTVLISVCLLIVVILAAVALNKKKKNTLQDSISILEVILETTNEAIHLWVADLELESRMYVSSPEFVELVEDQLLVPREKKQILQSIGLVKIREFFRLRLIDHRGTGIFIISPDFINIASMRDENIGVSNLINNKYRNLLEKVFEGSSQFIPPIESDVALFDKHGQLIEKYPTMFFATPVRNSSDKVIAVLTIRFDPFYDFSRLAEIGRIGETGETYFFDAEGRFLTESRFCDQFYKIGLIDSSEPAILSVGLHDPGGSMVEGFMPGIPREDQPLTYMAQQAIAGISGSSVRGDRDYRGVKVLSAWLWDEELNIGMATEIDLEEALMPYYEARFVLLSILVALVVLSTVLSIILTRIRQRNYFALERGEKRLIKINRKLFNKNAEMASFLKVVGHDLNAPLASISGLASMITRANTDILDESSTDRLIRIQDNVNSMSSLIDNLIELARIGEVREVFKLLNPMEVASKVVDDLKGMNENKSIEFVIERCDCLMLYDIQRLQQVFSNLISNAIKYIGDNPEPKITVKCNCDDTVVTILVEDNGIGIDEKDFENIFVPFRRLSSANGQPGIGIGLNIVKKIVEHNEGRLWVESEKGVGSTFKFTIPVKLHEEKHVLAKPDSVPV